MSEKVYRVGIIGLSGIAAGEPARAPSGLGTETPYSHAAAYDRFPQCRVEAVCDLSPERIDAFLKRGASVGPMSRPIPTPTEMFANHSFDIISVATPDHLHKEFVLMGCEPVSRGFLRKTTGDQLGRLRRNDCRGESARGQNERRPYSALGRSWQDARAVIDQG